MRRILATRHLSRREMLIGAGGFLTGLAGSSASAGMLLRMDRSPSISMLGSGSSYSVVIASGGVRLIIVQGSDPADFGNALGRSRVPFLDRTDIAIIAHPDAGAHFVRSALDRIQPERTWVVGSPNDLLDADIPITESLQDPTHFQLPGDLTLTMPHMPLPSTGNGGWTAILESAHRPVIISSGLSATMPGLLPERPAAWIHLDGKIPAEWINAIGPSTIALPAAAISGAELREIEAAMALQPFKGYRIHAGETTRLEISDLAT